MKHTLRREKKYVVVSRDTADRYDSVVVDPYFNHLQVQLYYVGTTLSCQKCTRYIKR